jgi:hypothetical protein
MRAVSKGRDYLRRERLVETVREQLAAIDVREGAGAEQGGERAAEAARQGGATREAVGQGRSGDGPQLSLVRRRDAPTRRVSEVSVVMRADVRHVCSWCATSKPKALPPLTLEHRRSGHETVLFVCAACVGPDSSVWKMFRWPTEAA